ncbi:MAG: phosphotransferase [Isosphaeraceae bacterium]
MLYFSVFQTVQTYTRSARELKARLPHDIDAMMEDARALARRMAPYVPVLCHNDLLPSNVLDDGERVWLVDWEYAGIGHPLFDLAGISANCALTPDAEAEFLLAYRGRLDPRDLAELRILKTMSLLREALWSVIQTVASDLPFDYVKYAEDNFGFYRAARAALDLTSPGL